MLQINNANENKWLTKTFPNGKYIFQRRQKAVPFIVISLKRQMFFVYHNIRSQFVSLVFFRKCDSVQKLLTYRMLWHTKDEDLTISFKSMYMYQCYSNYFRGGEIYTRYTVTLKPPKIPTRMVKKNLKTLM